VKEQVDIYTAITKRSAIGFALAIGIYFTWRRRTAIWQPVQLAIGQKDSKW
jgi:hypothetical protein